MTQNPTKSNNTWNNVCKWGSNPPCFGSGTLELGTHYHCKATSHKRDTVRRVGPFFTIFPSRTHVLPDRAAILDFAKGAFFEANWGKNHTLYLYLPELLICVKVVFYFVFSFTVKEGSKKGLRRNEDLLRIDNFFTSCAFYLIFCLMVLPLQCLYKLLVIYRNTWYHVNKS